MPYEIDQDALDNPSLTVMDRGKPPLRQIPYRAFPQMIYLHPRDKSKVHLTKIVQTDAELETAIAQGWRQKPHVPAAPVEDLSKDFEAEVLEEKRGPGRPPKQVAA
jgi:hypothetical protein